MNPPLVRVNNASDIVPVYRGTAISRPITTFGAPPRDVLYDEQAYGTPCEHKRKKARGEVPEILE